MPLGNLWIGLQWNFWVVTQFSLPLWRAAASMTRSSRFSSKALWMNLGLVDWPYDERKLVFIALIGSSSCSWKRTVFADHRPTPLLSRGRLRSITAWTWASEASLTATLSDLQDPFTSFVFSGAILTATDRTQEVNRRGLHFLYVRNKNQVRGKFSKHGSFTWQKSELANKRA